MPELIIRQAIKIDLPFPHMLFRVRRLQPILRRKAVRQFDRARTVGLRNHQTPVFIIRIRDALAVAKWLTAGNRDLQLCLALSYGGREAIVQAARTLARRAAAGLRPEAIDEAMFAAALDTHQLPPLDLVVRTSGEQRLSNFLLWEAAYAELYFTDVLWPDFGRAELEAALAAYGRRQRRFGLTGAQAAS